VDQRRRAERRPTAVDLGRVVDDGASLARIKDVGPAAAERLGSTRGRRTVVDRRGRRRLDTKGGRERRRGARKRREGRRVHDRRRLGFRETS
jgi:hypothetical protein